MKKCLVPKKNKIKNVILKYYEILFFPASVMLMRYEKIIQILVDFRNFQIRLLIMSLTLKQNFFFKNDIMSWVSRKKFIFLPVRDKTKNISETSF